MIRQFRVYAIPSSTRKTPQKLELFEVRAYQKLTQCSSAVKEKREGCTGDIVTLSVCEIIP